MTPFPKQARIPHTKVATSFCCLALLFGCTQAEGPFEEAAWDEIEKSFTTSEYAPAAAAFKRSCTSFEKQAPQKPLNNKYRLFGTYGDWQAICEKLKNRHAEDFPEFLKENLTPYSVNGTGEGLFTGYYAPVYEGSLKRTDLFHYPIHQKPKNLLTADLGLFDESLKGKQIVARVEGNRILPYHTREYMYKSGASPLVYLKDETDAFFLHIQGSGHINLPNGERMHIAYGGNNGHSYHAIGRTLVHKGFLTKENVSMESIRTWLKENPEKRKEVFNTNPRYIFFAKGNGKVSGSLGVELTPNTSMAVDPNTIPLGVPLFVRTALNARAGEPFGSFMVAQDTGAAIEGEARGDIYFGIGEKAERLAGFQNASGKLYVFAPKEATQ